MHSQFMNAAVTKYGNWETWKQPEGTGSEILTRHGGEFVNAGTKIMRNALVHWFDTLKRVKFLSHLRILIINQIGSMDSLEPAHSQCVDSNST